MSIDRIAQLTTRQREALRLYGQRFRVKEIARELGISENTVSGYLTEATALLGVGGRQAAAAALAAYEATHPETRGRFSVDAPTPPSIAPASPPADPPAPMTVKALRWWGLLVSRGNGNDLTTAERLLAVFAVIVLLATGFGFFAVFVRTVSDLVGVTRR